MTAPDVVAALALAEAVDAARSPDGRLVGLTVTIGPRESAALDTFRSAKGAK